MPLTLADLKAIVDAKQFDKLVGEVENEFFDAKNQPYQFDGGDYAKREFAKDVTSFANAGGGYIFIGAATTKSSTHPGDEVTELRPLGSSLIDRDRYYKILAEWTHPEPKGVAVEWIPFGAVGKGICVVTIPPQNDRTKPFLMAKTVDSGKSTETLLGYAERKRDSTDVLSVVELHQALRTGLNLEGEILSRIENLEAAFNRQLDDKSNAERTARQQTATQDRISTALAYENMGQDRAMVLVAWPEESTRLRTIFSDDPGSIRRDLENPPELRYAGWGLATRDQARFIKGERIRVVNGNRKVIDLYRDGTLVLAGRADQNFLAWASEDDRRLHPLAMIELIVNFMRFYMRVLDDLATRPAHVSLRCELRNMHLNDQKSYLIPHAINNFGFTYGSGLEAPENGWSIELHIAIDELSPDRTAYELIREIYFWFGHSETVIPYTAASGDGGVKRIDLDQIINIG